MRLSEICKEIGVDFVGDDGEIANILPLAEAGATDLSFIENEKYLPFLAESKAKAVILRAKHADFVPNGMSKIITEEPYLVMAKFTRYFAHKLISDQGAEPIIGENATILPNVYIGKNVTIGKNALIMAGASIGDGVTIGDNCTIYPNVTIYNRTKIGSNCSFHAGCVIGSDGFGYAHTQLGEHIKIYHLGFVEIEDSVEIGANTTIDRGAFGKTIIKSGTKIDNLVQIAHNCEIGAHSIIVSQVGISGSTKVGRNFVAGGQVGIAGHLKIGDFVTIGAKGGVTKNIPEKGTYSGFPIMPHRLWLRLQAKIAKLL